MAMNPTGWRRQATEAPRHAGAATPAEYPMHVTGRGPLPDRRRIATASASVRSDTAAHVAAFPKDQCVGPRGAEGWNWSK